MHQRQGSRGNVHNYNSVQPLPRMQLTLQPSLSKRSLEQQSFGTVRNVNYTPQHQLKSSQRQQFFRAQPQKTLRQILSTSSKPTDKSALIQKFSLKIDQDSIGSRQQQFINNNYTSKREHKIQNLSSKQNYQQPYPKVGSIEERLRRQNQSLKRQNESLRGDITVMRKQLSQTTTMRNNFDQMRVDKEQLERYMDKMGRKITDLERKCQLSQQESYLYKEIIEKLEKRVTVLLEENDNLQTSIQRSIKKLGEFDQLQDRLDKLRMQYRQIERVVQQDSEDWEIHKQLWINEREYYKEIIRKLQFQLSLPAQY